MSVIELTISCKTIFSNTQLLDLDKVKFNFNVFFFYLILLTVPFCFAGTTSWRTDHGISMGWCVIHVRMPRRTPKSVRMNSHKTHACHQMNPHTFWMTQYSCGIVCLTFSFQKRATTPHPHKAYIHFHDGKSVQTISYFCFLTAKDL